MPPGNGAYIVHKMLERELPGYRLCSYSPYWTLFPPSLYSLCRKRIGKADLIHTVPDHGLFFTANKVPLVLTFHNFVLDSFMQGYSTPLQRIHYRTDLCWFINASLRRAAVITSVSRYTADLVRKELGFAGDIRIINNGVDTNMFTPAVAGSSDGGPLRVLFAGNLTRRKGADLLPEIARQVNAGIRIICTSGLRTQVMLPESETLHQLGSIPYSDMPALYRSVDVLLLPSVREGFPLAVVEAMASGLPVIATDCSSLPELIDEGRGGYLCPAGDARYFSEKLNELADSPGLCKQMGDYNRARAEQEFMLENMVRKYQDLFDEVHDSR
ncbi:MAG: glycosyltransferase family 4 protein [Saprospiraceae bacterium]|nr:glycosyltransferase family 4 protein [Saprospiraceae bacterium]